MCFAKEYGVALDDYVMLRDPKRNVPIVQVEKKNGKVYFRHGWSGLRNFYKIELGAMGKTDILGSQSSAGVYKKQVRC
jgi:hypothetical protein